jgi:hypothetical protein
MGYWGSELAPYVAVESLLTEFHKTVLGYKNVATDVPMNLVDLLRTDPVIVLDRVGGGETVVTIDKANVDVDTFANSLDGVRLHAGLIHAAITTRLVGYIYQGTVVNRVETIRAPIKAAWDSRNVVKRRVGSYRITLHQFSGVS